MLTCQRFFLVFFIFFSQPVVSTPQNMQSWLVVVALFLASVALASADPTANLTSEKHSRGVYKCAYFAGTYSTRVLPSNEGTSDWCTAGVGELVIYPNCRLQIAEFYTLADQTCGHWWRNGVFSYQAGSTYGALRTIAASENSASTNANYDGFNSDRFLHFFIFLGQYFLFFFFTHFYQIL